MLTKLTKPHLVKLGFDLCHFCQQFRYFRNRRCMSDFSHMADVRPVVVEFHTPKPADKNDKNTCEEILTGFRRHPGDSGITSNPCHVRADKEG